MGRPANITPLTSAQRDRAARYIPLARRIARDRGRWGRRRHRADVVSAAFLALVTSARDYQANKGPFATFARKRIVGETGEAMRTDLATLNQLGGQSAMQMIPDKHNDFVVVDSTDAAEAILRKLPSPNATAFRLTAMDGLSQTEAAQWMGCCQNQVSRLIRQGRQLLGVS